MLSVNPEARSAFYMPNRVVQGLFLFFHKKIVSLQEPSSLVAASDRNFPQQRDLKAPLRALFLSLIEARIE